MDTISPERERQQKMFTSKSKATATSPITRPISCSIAETHMAQGEMWIRGVLDRTRHDGCRGRAGKAKLATGRDGASSRPVRRIVLQGQASLRWSGHRFRAARPTRQQYPGVARLKCGSQRRQIISRSAQVSNRATFLAPPGRPA
jgi:hypothetical protein